jgi:hypothetical protein
MICRTQRRRLSFRLLITRAFATLALLVLFSIGAKLR